MSLNDENGQKPYQTEFLRVLIPKRKRFNGFRSENISPSEQNP